MAKAVFTAKQGSDYDDDLETRYHFPRMYLNQVRAAVGDLAIYYEPRRGNGRQAYFAVVQINEVVADPSLADHFYANVGGLIELDRVVPFRIGEQFFESALNGGNGRTNLGSFQRAVRLIPEPEFEAIVAFGMTETSRTIREAPATIPGLQEPPDTFERPIVQQILNRPFRDAAFARRVKVAYDATCAVTGLRLINGGGRPEVEAAHIRPVERNGPDAIGNGLALCRTAHWMFDRGLISVGTDDRLLVATDLVSDDLRRLLAQDGRLRLPAEARFRPHQKFASWHRENVYKGAP